MRSTVSGAIRKRRVCFQCLGLLTRAQVGVDVAVLAWITLPTARGVDYLGERTPTVSPEVAISRGLGGWWFGGNLALTLRGTTQVYDRNKRKVSRNLVESIRVHLGTEVLPPDEE